MGALASHTQGGFNRHEVSRSSSVPFWTRDNVSYTAAYRGAGGFLCLSQDGSRDSICMSRIGFSGRWRSISQGWAWLCMPEGEPTGNTARPSWFSGAEEGLSLL